MPFSNHIHNPFDHNNYQKIEEPTSSSKDPQNPQDHQKQKQLDREAKHRADEKQRQQQKELKEDKRQDLLDKREEKEWARVQEQREHRQRKRDEGKIFGTADNLGHDPLSDVKLVKHAVGYEVRKRMPGFRWEDGK
ncbi:MAG: hypothetical protein Q9221_007184 [Calogaya cf. arnoldii]